jgi:hypothetical protein
MVRLNFVGDIGLFKEFQVRGIDPFKEIRLPESDFNTGNFEFIIPNKRDKYFFDVLDKYTVDYDYFSSLYLATFDAFGMANNHIMDYGKEGISDVTDIFKSSNISHFGVGTDDYNVLIQELKGISFAFIGFVKNGRWSRKQPEDFGPDPYDIEKLISKVKSLKEWVDHIIIFPHFGTELVDIPDPADVKNSRLLIDAGASAVIGHHPHIIQGIENYKDGIIAYSLGSFIYIPENEAGYHSGQNPNRDFSICLNLNFDQTKITEVKPYYYKYNKQLKIPIEFRDYSPYFDYVNRSINNSKEYHRKIRQVLLKRELISFYERFKNAPVSTLKHYFKYLNISHLKKIFS